MGCDIHWYVDRFTTDSEYDGPRDLKEDRDKKLSIVLENDETSKTEPRWVSADKWIHEDYGDDEFYWSNSDSAYYKGRNYQLFELLAGVRGDEYKAISLPRGIPDDCSYGYKTAVEQCYGYGHSFSYFTLTELLEIDWIKYKNDGYFLESILQTLENMKTIDSNTDNVRALFFFDN